MFIKKTMETITLNYDASNVQAQKALDFMLSLNLFQKKEKTPQLSRFEQSMLDIENGNIFHINGQLIKENESQEISEVGIVPPRRKGSLTEGFGFWEKRRTI